MKINVFLSLFIFIILIFFLGCLPRQKQETKGGEEKEVTSLTGKKILMVIAPQNFRDEEFQQPKAVFEATEAQVVVASKGVVEATGMLGGKVKVDFDLADVKVEDYDALVFIGGAGSSIYFNDQVALNLAKQAVSQNKVVGAICIAPSILANAEVLQGKKATAFLSQAINLKSKGANFSTQSVVVDGKIVTAAGPKVAKEFGEKIVEVLSS